MIGRALLFCVCVCALLAAGIDGKWRFKFDTPLGERQGVWEIATNGEEVTAKAANKTYRGSFRDGNLQMSATVYSPEGNVTDELKINGKLQGEQISGTAEFGGYTMKFVAGRAD